MINKWILKTIIGLDLCPFTQKPYLDGKILIEELSGSNTLDSQIEFLKSLESFQSQTKFQTALLAFPDLEISFEEFNEFTEDCQEHLVTLDLQEEFQLVAFHPKFCFEGLEFSDRANLVNSSPLPIIHILRKVDLDLINLSLKEAQSMSRGNEKKLNLLSHMEVLEHFPWRE